MAALADTWLPMHAVGTMAATCPSPWPPMASRSGASTPIPPGPSTQCTHTASNSTSAGESVYSVGPAGESVCSVGPAGESVYSVGPATVPHLATLTKPSPILHVYRPLACTSTSGVRAAHQVRCCLVGQLVGWLVGQLVA